MSVTYQYVDRAKCSECGYIWTTVDSRTGMVSDSIVCACGALSFVDGELVGMTSVMIPSETEFKQVVADDVGIDVNSLIIEQYS